MQQPPGWGQPPQYPQQPPYHQGYGPPPGYFPPPPPPPPKWYQASGPAAVAALLCCWPLGLVFLWGSPAFSRTMKILLTAATSVLILFGGVVMSLAPEKKSAAQPRPREHISPPTPKRSSGWPTPPEACRLLEDYEFASRRGWMDMTEGWGCVANQNPEPQNRIVLHAGGTLTEVTNIRLLLYVNQRSEETVSKHALVRYGDALFQATLGHGIPHEVRDAIMGGKGGRWTFSGRDVNLEHNERSPGYDQRLIVSVPGTAYPSRGNQ